MSHEPIRAGKAFLDALQSDPEAMKKWNRTREARIKVSVELLSDPEYLAILEEVKKYNREWEETYGEPIPQDIEDWERWVARANIPGNFLPAEKIASGHWTLADIMPFIEGYLLKLKDHATNSAPPLNELVQSPTTNKGKKTAPHYRDWTQSELDKAIQSEIEKYKDSIENASKGSKGAAKTIKDLFGRNKLADRLLVKPGSRKMISDSVVWQRLAKDANLPRNHQAGKHRPSKKVGFDLAIEQTPTVTIVEAIAKLEEAIAAIKYKDKDTTKQVYEVLNATKSKVDRGEYTPSKGIEIAELCIAQWRDEKTNKVPSKA